MADKVDFGPSIGADPELFLIALKGGEYTKNTMIPVCGLIGGTKHEPIPYKMDNARGKGGFAYQEDNVAFEFNTPVFRSSQDFALGINTFIERFEADVLAAKRLRFAWTSSHEFPKKFLQHPLAQTIGCSPDFHAYRPDDDMVRPPFDIEQLGDRRFAGGHIHLGYNYNNVPRHIMAKFMDVVVELPFLRFDKQGKRREFYGLPGVFRPKPYGLEYRTPSSFWLDPKFRRSNMHYYMANNALGLAAAANTNPGALGDVFRRIPWPDVQKAIQEEDHKLGDQIVGYIRNQFPSDIYGAREVAE